MLWWSCDVAVCVGAENEVNMKCVCVGSLYAAESSLRISTQVHSVADWLIHRLCRGLPCVCQSCVLGSCAFSCTKIATSPLVHFFR